VWKVQSAFLSGLHWLGNQRNVLVRKGGRGDEYFVAKGNNLSP
jgi:hypothetical protein